MEIATAKKDEVAFTDEALNEIYTKDAKTIDELATLLKKDKKQFIKAVCYAISGEKDKVVVAFVRGDKEVNEAKLKKHLGVEDIAVTDISETGLVKGNIGCVDLEITNIIKVFDKSLEGLTGMICGANKEEYHLGGVNLERDVKPSEYVDIIKVNEGDLCHECGAPIIIKKGIEVGNIFKLDTKYTKTMDMTISMVAMA